MKILIKIGSALTSKNNKFNQDLIEKKVKEIAELQKMGNQIIIVSSGAVACGMDIENLNQRPKDTLKLQLLSGEGQIVLMKCYKELFEKENIRISQILLTHHNFDKEKEKEAITKIIKSYLKQNIIPIINENDLINKEELESNSIFTDNDILAALLGSQIKVDQTLILTDVDGLYEDNPKTNKNCKLIEEVNEINDSIKNMASKKTNHLGLGGMYSKIIAAEILKKNGIKTIVANGNSNIIDILENKIKRTCFNP
ncbi:Isopentenyl phosphate kinase [uncultured archaeon]|nr:Isopentenyl phosphate kinase [uncultured archaeon]